MKSNTPVLMCSVPGHDASGRVDDLAAELGKTISSIAIGSAEGFNQAEKAINSASKSGRSVHHLLVSFTSDSVLARSQPLLAIRLSQMGDAEERPPCSAMARPARKETAQHSAALRVPSVPDDRDQSQGAGEPAESRTMLRLRAATRRQGQLAAHVQHNLRLQNDEGAYCRVNHFSISGGFNRNVSVGLASARLGSSFDM